MSEVLNFKQHKLLHGDITKGSVDILMNKEKFDILYSDPPWGIGSLKMFHTLNSKMNNVEQSKVCWDTFVNCFPDIINKYSHENSIVIIEMSIKFYDVFKNVIQTNTEFELQQIFNTNYKSGSTLRPLKIMYFSKKNHFRFDEEIITCLLYTSPSPRDRG